MKTFLIGLVIILVSGCSGIKSNDSRVAVFATNRSSNVIKIESSGNKSECCSDIKPTENNVIRCDKVSFLENCIKTDIEYSKNYNEDTVAICYELANTMSEAFIKHNEKEYRVDIV